MPGVTRLPSRLLLWVWCALLLALVMVSSKAWAGSGLDPQEVLDQLHNVKVDPDQVYVLRHAQLIRDRAKIYFNRGYIGFLTKAAGEITGAVYVGEGEILLIPPTQVEKESLARFIHSPILEEQFTMAILRFTDQTAKELIAEIHKVTQLPIRYLVNSHYHADHSHGNQAFPEDVELISSHAAWQGQLNKDLPQLQRYQQLLPEQIDRLRKELNSAASAPRANEIRQELQQREQFLNRIRGLEIVLAGTTFDHTLSLRTLNRELQLLFLGKGHTDGDIVLWLPEERILFAGDLVSNGALPNLMDGYSKDWIDTLAAITKMKPEVIVPGHGPAGDDGMVSSTREFLQDLRKTVKSGMDKGSTLEDLLRSIQVPARFRDFRGQQFLPGAIERVYRELLEEAAAEKKATP